MANIYQKSIFEFKSQITISSDGSNFTTLVATDDLNTNLQAITNGDPLYATHSPKVTWSDSNGGSGTVTESTTLTEGTFVVLYPTTTDPGNGNRLRITIQDPDITQSQYTVTVSVIFYAKIKTGQFDNLLASSPLKNIMYFNIDTADITTAAPATMTPATLQKFDIYVLGTPVTLERKVGEKFSAIYVFSGFTDQTSVDDNLLYKLTINDLPEVSLTNVGATITDLSGNPLTGANATADASGDITVTIPYLSAKGKTVLVRIPATTLNPVLLATSPLYIPCKAQLIDNADTSNPTEIDYSNTNVQVTLAPSTKTLSGGVKTLV